MQYFIFQNLLSYIKYVKINQYKNFYIILENWRYSKMFSYVDNDIPWIVIIILLIILAAIIGIWYIISPDTLDMAREYITNLITNQSKMPDHNCSLALFLFNFTKSNPGAIHSPGEHLCLFLYLIFLTGSTCQIFLAYSLILRSEENLPQLAIFRNAFLV